MEGYACCIRGMALIVLSPHALLQLVRGVPQGMLWMGVLQIPRQLRNGCKMGLFATKSMFFAPSSLAKIGPFFAKFTRIFWLGLALDTKTANTCVLPIASQNGLLLGGSPVFGNYFSLFGNFL